MGKVMFSLCPHWGGGGVRSKVNPAGGGGVSGQRSIQPGGGGCVRSKVNPAGGDQGQSNWGGVRSKVNSAGGVRSKVNPARGGVRSKVNPARGGSGPAGWGGVRSSQGGVSILCPLVGGMPLAFTQEDFLVGKMFLLQWELALSLSFRKCYRDVVL